MDDASKPAVQAVAAIDVEAWSEMREKELGIWGAAERERTEATKSYNDIMAKHFASLERHQNRVAELYLAEIDALDRIASAVEAVTATKSHDISQSAPNFVP